MGHPLRMQLLLAYSVVTAEGSAHSATVALALNRRRRRSLLRRHRRSWHGARGREIDGPLMAIGWPKFGSTLLLCSHTMWLTLAAIPCPSHTHVERLPTVHFSFHPCTHLHAAACLLGSACYSHIMAQ